MGERVPLSLRVSRELNPLLNLSHVLQLLASDQAIFTNSLLYYSKENDVLLLSQCFDDTALKRHFQPPEGTELLGFTNSVDEVSACIASYHLFIHFIKGFVRVS